MNFHGFSAKCDRLTISPVQCAADAIASIRNQIDVWAIKKWNEQLSGEQFKWIFPVIKNKREMIAERYRFNKDGWTIADSSYPRVEDLSNKWFYALLDGYYPKLTKVPNLGIRHKEPVDDWELITGIKIIHDQSMIENESHSGKARVSSSDEKLLYQDMLVLKSKKGSTWDDVRLQLAEKQKNVIFHQLLILYLYHHILGLNLQN